MVSMKRRLHAALHIEFVNKSPITGDPILSPISFQTPPNPLTTISMLSWRFLQDAANVSDVAYSKYQSLFFMRLLNLCGFFSRSKWNLTQMAASWGNKIKALCGLRWEQGQSKGQRRNGPFRVTFGLHSTAIAISHSDFPEKSQLDWHPGCHGNAIGWYWPNRRNAN